MPDALSVALAALFADPNIGKDVKPGTEPVKPGTEPRLLPRPI
jgi:hypothetical protein